MGELGEEGEQPEEPGAMDAAMDQAAVDAPEDGGDGSSDEADADADRVGASWNEQSLNFNERLHQKTADCMVTFTPCCCDRFRFLLEPHYVEGQSILSEHMKITP